MPAFPIPAVTELWAMLDLRDAAGAEGPTGHGAVRRHAVAHGGA